MIENDMLLDYLFLDTRTWVLFWSRSPGGGVRQGAVAGHIPTEGKSAGYVTIRFRGHLFLAHRVVWRICKGFWPTERLDHKDLNRSNNSISNLREATHSQNCRNVNVRRHSRSGLKGVGWAAHAKKWKAKIKVDHRQVHLGYFSTAELAHQAYALAAASHCGEFARP